MATLWVRVDDFSAAICATPARRVARNHLRNNATNLTEVGTEVRNRSRCFVILGQSKELDAPIFLEADCETTCVAESFQEDGWSTRFLGSALKEKRLKYSTMLPVRIWSKASNR